MRQKPLARIEAIKQYRCPECMGVIPEVLLRLTDSDELACPSCKETISLPRIGREGIREGNERRDARCPVVLKVTYQSASEFKTEYTRNVSRGGMFIATDNPPETGAKVEIGLCLPELNEPIVLMAEVVHRQVPGDSFGEPGVGVKFIDIDPISRGVLANYLRHLPGCG